MTFSINGVGNTPRFGGVYIKAERMNGEMTAVNFMVVPDSVFKGVRYEGQVVPSVTADQLTYSGTRYKPLAPDQDPASNREIDATSTDSITLSHYHPVKIVEKLKKVVAEATQIDEIARPQIELVLAQHLKQNEGPDYSVRSKAGENWATFTFEDSEAIMANMSIVTVPVDRRGITGPAKHHHPLQRRAEVSLSFPAMPAITIQPNDPNLAAGNDTPTTDTPPAPVDEQPSIQPQPAPDSNKDKPE